MHAQRVEIEIVSTTNLYFTTKIYVLHSSFFRTDVTLKILREVKQAMFINGICQEWIGKRVNKHKPLIGIVKFF